MVARTGEVTGLTGQPSLPSSPLLSSAIIQPRTRLRPRRPARAARSVAGVPLFFPRVTVVVVAVALPESGRVVLPELDAAHPLRALPEVEVGDEQPRRPAVLRVERLVLVFVGDPRLPIADVRERQVRRVTTVAERENELGARVDAVEQRFERNASPRCVQLRPLGDAVDVDGDPLTRERNELLPGPGPRFVDLAADLEAPRFLRLMRRRPRREHGEVRRDVLARRYAPRI